MSKEFDDCLKKRKITEFERAKGLVKKELDQANDDLESAKDSFGRGSHKWATIQSYYSMFHSARALIYFRGFRERSHYCLIVAIRVLFVQEGLLRFSEQTGHPFRFNSDTHFGTIRTLISGSNRTLFKQGA